MEEKEEEGGEDEEEEGKEERRLMLDITHSAKHFHITRISRSVLRNHSSERYS